MRFRIAIDQGRCKGCALCIVACEREALRMSKQFNAKGLHFAEAWQEGKCVGCAHCAEICPDGAIEIAQAQESLPTPPKPERPAPQRLHEILAGTASGHSSKGDR